MKPTQVRRIRKELGVSTLKLGKMLGATDGSAQNLVWRWEHGKNKPSRANAQLLERLLAEHRAKYPLGKGHEGEGNAA